MTELEELFGFLRRPEAQDDKYRVFSVHPIPDAPAQFVARTEAYHPAILVEMGQGHMSRAPIALEHLRVTFNVECRLSLGDDQRQARMTVVECLSEDEEVRRYFLVVAGRVLKRLGADATADQIGSAIDALASLFQRLSRSPAKDAQGLFGELVVIDQAAEPIVLVEGWRADPEEHFDFAWTGLRLEVKTNSTRQRRHRFSLEQCSPPRGTDGVLVSLFVEKCGGGLSLDSLVLRIEGRIATRPDLVIKLHDCVAASLGLGLVRGLGRRFDERLARGSIRFYDLTEIPAVRGGLPNGVSGVSFISDLGGMMPEDVQGARTRFPSLCGLFANW